MDVPLNEYEISEIQRLITIGFNQTDSKEMHSDMIRMILDGITRILDNAQEKRTRNQFEYVPPSPTGQPYDPPRNINKLDH